MNVIAEQFMEGKKKKITMQLQFNRTYENKITAVYFGLSVFFFVTDCKTGSGSPTRTPFLTYSGTILPPHKQKHAKTRTRTHKLMHDAHAPL